MSHLNEFKSTITDEAALLKALCRVDCFGRVQTRQSIEVHKNAVPLTGYATENKRAHIVIRRNNAPGSYNDLGFFKGQDGTYQAMIGDNYDQKWLGKLTMYYNVEKSKQEFADRGIECVETKDEKGRIQLRAKFKTEVTNRVQVKVR